MSEILVLVFKIETARKYNIEKQFSTNEHVESLNTAFLRADENGDNLDTAMTSLLQSFVWVTERSVVVVCIILLAGIIASAACTSWQLVKAWKSRTVMKYVSIHWATCEMLAIQLYEYVVHKNENEDLQTNLSQKNQFKNRFRKENEQSLYLVRARFL